MNTLPPVIRVALWMCFTAIGFAVMIGSVRELSAHLDVFVISFWRNLAAVLLFLPWIARMGLGGLKTERWGLFWLRAVIMLASSVAMFLGAILLPLSEATALSFTTPLFVTLLAWVVLGERFGWRRGAAVAIGFVGVLIMTRPDAEALNLGALVVLRPLVYVVLLLWLRQRARTALLVGLSLATYSEFGLIVAQLAADSGTIDTPWVTTIALALALSFFIATPLNNRARDIYARLAPLLQANERGAGSTDDAIATLGGGDIVIVGAGRVGVGAYRYLVERYPDNVVCIEESGDKATALQAEGINCVHGDGNDRDFWGKANLAGRKLILVSLTNHKENMSVVKFLKTQGFSGDLAVVSRYPDEEQEIRDAGCITFNLYAEAGHGFAEHVLTHTGNHAGDATA